MTATNASARRWLGTAALAAGAMLALVACTTIPTSGPVNEGSGVVSSSGPYVATAEGPRQDASPTAIVNGFVTASSAGFASDFTIARQYLMPDPALTWDPSAQVTVFDTGALNPNFDDKTSTVTYDVPVAATIDDSGRLTEAADGTRETLTFQMAQDDEGQWRIADLEDGTIIASATFKRLFSPASLIFASVDQTTEVPELRWLPANNIATLAARELVEGPSPWLAGAVHTGFPAASALELQSVVVDNGVASVQLNAASAGNAEQRSLADAQMQSTLTGIPGITSVNVTVGGLPIGGDGSADLKAAPFPEAEAAAFVNGRLGVWDGEKVWQVREDVGGLPAGSRGLAQTFGEPTAAWIVNGSSLVASTALAKGVASLDAAGADAEPAVPPMEVQTLYEGSNLVAPSADRHGWFWTTQGDGNGDFVAVKPDGTIAKMPVDWLRGTSVQALAVSRDGARVAVLSRTGDKQSLEVASVVRGDDGAPLTIGEPLVVGVDLGPSIDLTWVDELTVAVLGGGGGDVPSDLWLVDVGGLTTAQKSVTSAVGITAREQERSIVVVDNQNRVFARSGTWSQVATGPAELAYSG